MTTQTEKSKEIAEFLKTQSIFQVLDKNILEGLSPLFTEIECGPGRIIFKEGDQADALYVIKSGSVAVLQSKPQARVITYLTAGECFGEMAIVQDAPRNATIRVPEEAVVLRLPLVAFKELTRRFPAVTSEITDVISRRSVGNTPFKAPGLQGNLAFFDLPTVIQTVISSRQNGTLTLFGRNGKVIGELVIKNTGIAMATFDQLKGEYALYELLMISDPLDFTFDQHEIKTSEVHPDLMRRPPHMLMIEGARRADELPKLMKEVGYPSSSYVAMKSVPDLSKFDERKELVRTLWTLIEMGGNAETICKQVNYDRYAVLGLIDELVKANMLKIEPGRKITEEFRRRTSQVMKPKLGSSALAVDALKIEDGADSPSELLKVVNSLNAVTSNLGIIYGKLEVRMLLVESLAKASKLFPVLAGLRVHVDTPCLDLRGASEKFSHSADSVSALILVSNLFLEQLMKMQNADS